MKNNNGFTLIELAVVLIIVSLLVVGAAQAFKIWLVQHRLDTTKERIATIENALVSYVQSTGDLPCAASLTAARGDADYARESTCAGALPAGTFQADGRGGSKVRIGAVPVRTLNLSDEYLADPWGNRFIYAVTESLANDAPLFDQTLGAIDVVDESGASVLTPAGSALYALASPGWDGKGAYTVAGVAVAPCTGTPSKDQENCDNDATFSAAAYSTNDGNSSFYDDFGAYATEIENGDLFYVKQCAAKGMLFAPSDPDADAEGCIFAPTLADMSCPSGEAIIGFSGGGAQCAPVGGGDSCPPGQTWDGTQCVPQQPQCVCTEDQIGAYGHYSEACGEILYIRGSPDEPTAMWQCSPSGWQLRQLR